MKNATYLGVVAALISALMNPARAQMVPPGSGFTPVPKTMVEVAEKDIGHTTCMAYRHTGLPVFFAVKTYSAGKDAAGNDDIFWRELPEVRKCLLLVKKWIDDPKGNLGEMKLIPYEPEKYPPLSGKFGDIRCTKADAKNVGPTLTVFYFPYLKRKKDIENLLHETPLRICVDSMTSTDMPAPPTDWSKKG